MDATDRDRQDADKLVTPNALATRWGIPPKRIRRAIRDGDLPAFRFGAWLRVRLGDAREWRERHRFRPADL